MKSNYKASFLVAQEEGEEAVVWEKHTIKPCTNVWHI